MSGHPGYQTIYNVGLLDDLHNYFPELLYNQGRFQNLTQVFHYVRGQMNRRFNLYAFGAQQHMDNNFATQTGLPPQSPLTPAQTVIHEVPSPRVVSVREMNENVQAANLLLSLFGAGLEDPPTRRAQQPADIWNTFRQPVVVRPTAEIIRRNSEELTGASLGPGTVCTICQDTIGQIDTCRKLRPCNHAFHKVCIDQWFERSVFCPTCRHDIRESAPTTTAP
jgi:hypothetical protein